MFRFTLLLIFLLSTPAMAEVYQCIDAEGRISFQEEPCDISETVTPIEIGQPNIMAPIPVPERKPDTASVPEKTEPASPYTGCNGILIDSVTPFSAVRTQRHIWYGPRPRRGHYPRHHRPDRERPDHREPRHDRRGEKPRRDGRDGRRDYPERNWGIYGRGDNWSFRYERDYYPYDHYDRYWRRRPRTGFSVHTQQCANVRAKLTGYFGQLYTERMLRKLTDRFYATFADGTVEQAETIEAPEGRVNPNEWINLTICFGALDLPIQEVHCE